MEGGQLTEPLPAWLIEANDAYRIAKVLPGWTQHETDYAPSILIDRILEIDGIYEKVRAKQSG